jgi:hypothetical protein
LCTTPPTVRRARPDRGGSTIATILQVVAQITQALTQAVPVPMTNVVTGQPYTTAGSFQAAGLQIGT